MFDWLRKLMAGDQSAPPPGVDVVRDDRGRIISAHSTLRPPAPEGSTLHPPLRLDEASKPALSAACAWLHGRNIEAAQGWGLGLETTFSFDQDDGDLVLAFDGAGDLRLQAQLLGTFDPRDRGFMWGWHNPSFRPELRVAAEAARREGERNGEPGFTLPVQSVTFDDLAVLLARAAQIAGADGVYRAITNGSTSVYLAYRLAGAPRRLAPPDPGFAAEALALAERHDRDQMQQDRLYHERDSTDPDLLERIIAAKRVSYLRDWSRSDDYWEPCSAGWPSNHDRSGARAEFLAPHPSGGVVVVSIADAVQRTVYRIERVGAEPKITDQLIDWGSGFLWPAVETG